MDERFFLWVDKNISRSTWNKRFRCGQFDASSSFELQLIANPLFQSTTFNRPCSHLSLVAWTFSRWQYFSPMIGQISSGDSCPGGSVFRSHANYNRRCDFLFATTIRNSTVSSAVQFGEPERIHVVDSVVDTIAQGNRERRQAYAKEGKLRDSTASISEQKKVRDWVAGSAVCRLMSFAGMSSQWRFTKQT